MFCLLVKKIGSSAEDPSLIPDSSQLRQKSDVEHKLQICNFLKLEILIQF